MADNLSQVLSAIHLELAQQLLDRIRSGEATAAEYNVARQFLKDNGIDSTPKANRAMLDLSKVLPLSIDDIPPA